MQHGHPTGEWTSLMKLAVEKLSTDDIIDIVAYLSFRRVVAAPAPR